MIQKNKSEDVGGGIRVLSFIYLLVF